MRRPVRGLVVLTLLLVIPGPGCRAPRIRERPGRAAPVVRRGAWKPIAGTAISVSSEVVAWARLKAEVEGPAGAPPARLLDLADLSDEIGSRWLRRDPAAALPWFRDAASYAMFALSSAGPSEADSPLPARAVALHNHAVEQLLRCAGSGPGDVNAAWREQLAAVGVEAVPTTPAFAAIPYDELWIAADFRAKNLDQVGRDGLGVALIAVSYFPDRKSVPGRFLPERLRLPATAVLRPAGPLRDGSWRSRPTMLELHDTAHESEIALRLSSRPCLSRPT